MERGKEERERESDRQRDTMKRAGLYPPSPGEIEGWRVREKGARDHLD